MTEFEKNAVIGLATGTVTKESVLKLFATHVNETDQLVLRLLNASFLQKDPDGVECALILGFVFGFAASHLRILCAILDVDWHHSHEDAVSALSELRDPSSIDALVRATSARHNYLAFDESRALATKAISALSQINDSTAIEQLRSLSASNDPIVAMKSTQRLEK